MRRRSLRFAEEQAWIEARPDLLRSTACRKRAPAIEFARCQRLIKGYGDTFERGLRNFNRIVGAYRTRPDIAPTAVFGLREAGNTELLDQILASRDTMVEILREAEATGPDPLSDYVTSERTVWFGHPAHPAPKARMWAVPGDERRFAPEHGATFRLHRWEVDRAGLHIRTSGLDEAAALAAVSDQAGAASGRAILSLHPAQAKLLLRDERVREVRREQLHSQWIGIVRSTARDHTDVST